jgi:hypothetical protein
MAVLFFLVVVCWRGGCTGRVDRHLHDAHTAREALCEWNGGDGVLVGNYGWPGGVGIFYSEGRGEIGRFRTPSLFVREYADLC